MGGYPAKFMCMRKELEEKFMKDEYKLFVLKDIEAGINSKHDILDELERNKRCFIK